MYKILLTPNIIRRETACILRGEYVGYESDIERVSVETPDDSIVVSIDGAPLPSIPIHALTLSLNDFSGKHLRPLVEAREKVSKLH